MNKVVVRVEGLGKRYRLGALQRYKTLRDAAAEALQAPWRIGPRSVEWFWALRNVSFDIGQGQVVGVIGRNGAGKSTLLKILSRITEPSAGHAEIYGRVGSLLEVGTGFHPELTGRENIYLNGAILGMKRREIGRKFDDIVAFAEVERFLDTPMKQYSNGMYVRLAFAVAAQLDPEILLVDEVLAVGDAAFQKKCLGKMEDVARGGRTVLLVSHQMNAIRTLCDQCLWLDGGQVRMADVTLNVLQAYEASCATASGRAEPRGAQERSGTCFLDWQVLEPRAAQPNVLTGLGPMTVAMRLQVDRPLRGAVHGIALWNSDRQLMWAWAAYRLNFDPGIYELSYALPTLPLRPGAYSWQVSLYHEGNLVDVWHAVPDLMIATPPMTHPQDEWSGVLNVPCEFRLRETGAVHAIA